MFACFINWKLRSESKYAVANFRYGTTLRCTQVKAMLGFLQVSTHDAPGSTEIEASYSAATAPTADGAHACFRHPENPEVLHWTDQSTQTA